MSTKLLCTSELHEYKEYINTQRKHINTIKYIKKYRNTVLQASRHNKYILVVADGGPMFSSLYLSACDGELNSIRMGLSTGDLNNGMCTHTHHMTSIDVTTHTKKQTSYVI